MKRKLTLILSMFLIAGLMLGCSTNNDTNGDNDDLETFTLTELAEYDGVDGNPAYVAVDGIIYDVTDVEEWMGGVHNDIMAGGDRTQEIEDLSPHGKEVLDGLPVVGKLEE